MTAEQSIRNIERLMDAVNAAAQVQPDPRADLVDLFEAHAETHDDKSWIEVEEAVDLVMDREAEITDAQVEAAAKALCRIAYPMRSLEEALTPAVLPLWQRFKFEARGALEAARGADS